MAAGSLLRGLGDEYKGPAAQKPISLWLPLLMGEQPEQSGLAGEWGPDGVSDGSRASGTDEGRALWTPAFLVPPQCSLRSMDTSEFAFPVPGLKV